MWNGDKVYMSVMVEIWTTMNMWCTLQGSSGILTMENDGLYVNFFLNKQWCELCHMHEAYRELKILYMKIYTSLHIN